MRPPICAVCGLDFRDDSEEGGSVQFVLSKDDEAYNARMEKTGMTGHPAGFEWFCGAHIQAAEALKDKTLEEAIKRLRKNIR